MPRQRNCLVDGFDLRARFGERTFALSQLDIAVQSTLHPLAYEIQELLALLQRSDGDVALGHQTRQSNVALGNARRDNDSRASGVSLRRARRADRGVEGSVILAEQVWLPTRARAQGGTGHGAGAQRRRIDAFLAESLARDIKAAFNARRIACGGEICP